jgi:hypothetical protein
MAICREIIH